MNRKQRKTLEMAKAKTEDEPQIVVHGLNEQLKDAQGRVMRLREDQGATLRDALVLIWQSGTSKMSPKEKARRGALAMEVAELEENTITYAQSDCEAAKEIIGLLNETMVVKRVWDALEGKKDWFVFKKKDLKPTPATDL